MGVSHKLITCHLKLFLFSILVDMFPTKPLQVGVDTLPQMVTATLHENYAASEGLNATNPQGINIPSCSLESLIYQSQVLFTCRSGENIYPLPLVFHLLAIDPGLPVPLGQHFLLKPVSQLLPACHIPNGKSRVQEHGTCIWDRYQAVLFITQRCICTKRVLLTFLTHQCISLA